MGDKTINCGAAVVEPLEGRTLFAAGDANLLTGVRTEPGTLSLGGEEKPFTVRLEADGWLRGRADIPPDAEGKGGSSGNGSFRVFLRGPSGESDGKSNVLSTWAYGARRDGSNHGAKLKAGTYTVIVKRTGDPRPEHDKPKSFTLTLAADYAGPTFDEAREAGRLAGTKTFKTYFGTIGTAGANVTDVYHYDVASPTQATFWTSGLAAQKHTTSLTVYLDSNGNRRNDAADKVVASKRIGSADPRVAALVPAGSVFVVVTGGPKLVDYSFGWTAAAPQPALAAVPGNLDFGPVTIRRDKTLEVRVRNRNTTAVRATVEDPGGPFSVAAGGGDFTVAGGKDHVIKVRFAPKLFSWTLPFAHALGEKKADLTISADDGSGRPLVIPLRGVAEGAKPTNWRAVAVPSGRPGVLHVRNYFGSTSGRVEDLINTSAQIEDFQLKDLGITVRESLNVLVNGTVAHQNPYVPAPPFSPTNLANPPAGAIKKSVWRPPTGIRVVGTNLAVLQTDQHGFTAFDPARRPTKGGELVLRQRYQYQLPWVDDGNWVTAAEFRITRKVYSERQADGSLRWYFRVSKADAEGKLVGQSEPLALPAAPPPQPAAPAPHPGQ